MSIHNLPSHYDDNELDLLVDKIPPLEKGEVLSAKTQDPKGPNPTPTLSLPLKGREIVTRFVRFLPLQGGG